MTNKGSNERRNAYEPKDLNCSYLAYYQTSVRLVTKRTLFITKENNPCPQQKKLTSRQKRRRLNR